MGGEGVWISMKPQFFLSMFPAIREHPVRYGIVGVGGYGGVRRRSLRRAGVFQIVGGVDPNVAAFAQAEQEEGCPVPRYETVEALVSDPQVEAIFVATPASFHIDQAFAAAKAGKAIFVEKPLGHELSHCRELVEYCQRNGIPHGHGLTERYLPVWGKVKQLLEEGELGTIASVSTASMHTGGLAFGSENWRFRKGENPGGPLFQCGIHKIDLLRYLFGEGHWLSGVVNRTVTPSSTDDSYIMLGLFGGIPCTLHSHYVASYRHAMEIYGTKGDLFVSTFPTKLEIKRTDLTSGFEPVHDLTPLIPDIDAEVDALRSFAKAVREGRPSSTSGWDGLRALELVFQAIEIAQEITLPHPGQERHSSKVSQVA